MVSFLQQFTVCAMIIRLCHINLNTFYPSVLLSPPSELNCFKPPFPGVPKSPSLALPGPMIHTNSSYFQNYWIHQT